MSEVFKRAARKVGLFSKSTCLGAGSGVIEGGAALFILRPSVEGFAIPAGDVMALLSDVGAWVPVRAELAVCLF
jgi:hypothetical protein